MSETTDSAITDSATDTSSGPVVVGIDGSENSGHAARWAAGEAALRRGGTSLTIVHALELPDTAVMPMDSAGYAQQRRSEGNALLEATANAVHTDFPDLTIDIELADQGAADTLSSFTRGASLLVTGTRGRGGFAGLLVGSVARKMARHAQCPLVVVREAPAQSQPQPPQDQADTVVLGVGRKPSPAAVRFAFEEARRYEAALTVVRAWWPTALYSALAVPGAMFVDDLDAARDAAIEELKATVEPMRGEFPDVAARLKFDAVEGNAVPVLVEAVRGGRLLVVAAHRRRGPLSVGAGYVVDGVLSHCPTPVAVVPTVP